MLTIDQILQRLGNLSFSQDAEELGKFDSYSRSVALVFVMARAPTVADRLRVSRMGQHLRRAVGESITNCRNAAPGLDCGRSVAASGARLL
jgi:hypothetical protein